MPERGSRRPYRTSDEFFGALSAFNEQRDGEDGIYGSEGVQDYHTQLGRSGFSVGPDDVKLTQHLRTEQDEQRDCLTNADLEVQDNGDREEALCRRDPNLHGLLLVEREGPNRAS